MAYQVLARKWRPQRFDDVVGQRGVTQTLRNAIARERVAQAFVFAGPRGVGKTTTARILARALNCVEGPTADPCGECDVCREVAEGRDIDVLEIDAATHTQVDNVREVIISGLSIAPVRDRHKIFIIDEVHQLSSSSFNALLKSVEEPPPHVVFIMATTLLDKIPDTILSRSQVFEFRTIGTAAIAEQLRKIVETEKVAVDEAGLALIARAAGGSMRDAQSALDQVIAFAGESIGAGEVSAVLGLVARDAVLDVAETVAAEAADGVFDLAGRFVEAGYDLRSVCRELARLVRDLMVLKVDARRIADPEIAADAERERLQALADRFSREDLLRGFDVLSRAELDIRNATQPRYHFEMAMLRWIHLRRLVPLTELLDGAGRLDPARPAAGGTGRPGQGGPPGRQAAAPGARRPLAPARSSPPRGRPAGEARRTAGPASAPSGPAAGSPASRRRSAPRLRRPRPRGPRPSASSPTRETARPAPVASPPAPAAGSAAGLKERFLVELQRKRRFFHGTVAAQARDIEVEDGRITFVFTTAQRTLAQQVENARGWIEPLAAEVAGRKTAVVVRQVAGAEASGAGAAAGGMATGADLRQPALTASPPEPPPPSDLEPPGESEPPVDLGPPVDVEPSALGSPVRSGPSAHPVASPVQPGPPAHSPAVSPGSPVQSAFLPSAAGPSADSSSAPLGSPVQPDSPPSSASAPLGSPVQPDSRGVVCVRAAGVTGAARLPAASASAPLGRPVQPDSPPPSGRAAGASRGVVCAAGVTGAARLPAAAVVVCAAGVSRAARLIAVGRAVGGVHAAGVAGAVRGHVAVRAARRARARVPGVADEARTCGTGRRPARAGAGGSRGADHARRVPGRDQGSRRDVTAMNIQKMMQQAQQMQENLQKQLREATVEATAGGGMVTVVMNGVKEIQRLRIDPEVVSPDDVEMLQDLIVAAVSDAQRRADELASQRMGGMMGGLKIPGLS